MVREMGKVSSLWPACPGSPCAALRGKLQGCPCGGTQGHVVAQGQGAANTLNGGVVALCPFSYSLGYRTSGSAKASWNASIPELQAGRGEERLLLASLGIPAHLLVGLCSCVCWCLGVEAGKDSGMVAAAASTPLPAVQGQEGSWAWYSSHVLPFLAKGALIYQDFIYSYCLLPT